MDRQTLSSLKFKLQLTVGRYNNILLVILSIGFEYIGDIFCNKIIFTGLSVLASPGKVGNLILPTNISNFIQSFGCKILYWDLLAFQGHASCHTQKNFTVIAAASVLLNPINSKAANTSHPNLTKSYCKSNICPCNPNTSKC